jgi:hypothetical protein
MRACVRVEEWLHPFLTSALDGDEWSDSRLSHFIPHSRCQFERRLAGSRRLSGHFGEEKNIWSPAENAACELYKTRQMVFCNTDYRKKRYCLAPGELVSSSPESIVGPCLESHKSNPHRPQ